MQPSNRNARFLTLVLSLSVIFLSGLSKVIAEQPPLNIVLIVVDDLGWTDLGCTGSSFYETPHIDQLAQDGTLFFSAYATCPVCSPTRSSLMTGKYPQRTGITDYCGAAQPANWKRDTLFLPAPYRDRLELEEVTIAERLQQGGYRTLFAGKWHLGPEGYWPEDQGFDLNFGGIERGGPYGGSKYFSPYGNPRLTDGPPGEHLPDRLASETAQFIRRSSDQPFFACVCFYSVHTPLMTRDDLKTKYELKRERQTYSRPVWGQEGKSKVRMVQEHAVYAGMIESMDAAVGKIIDAVDEAGLRDRTAIFFTSDNGGLATSEGHPTSNFPLRAGKGWMYEGGIRVPTIVRIPPPQPTDRVSRVDEPINSADFFPTIVDLCQLPRAESDGQWDGRSFLPLLRSQPWKAEPLFWHYPHYGNQGGSPSAAIRDGDWKLIEFLENGKQELYDLRKDPSEAFDLADTHPELARNLSEQLHRWQREVGAKPLTPRVPPQSPPPQSRSR